MNKTIELFKAHIIASTPYRGGYTREDASNIRHKMSSNENMTGVSPLALQAMRDNLHLVNEYSFENDRRLCQALATHFDNTPGPDQFITANGGTELLDIIIRGFVQPGNEVIISTPTFMAYHSLAVLGGAKVVDVPLSGFDYTLDVDGIVDAITEETRLIFICNPNNPTGTLVGRSVMDALMEQVPDHVVVVYDEVYRDYVQQTENYPGAVEYIRQYKHIIGLHSFSKAYGLAGMRVAYAFSTHSIASYLQKIRRPFMVNALSTVAAIAALEDHAFLHLTQTVNQDGKIFLYKQFSKYQIAYTPSETNFILITPPRQMKVADFMEAMQKEGIMVRDAEGMGARGKVRITIGTMKANFYLRDALRRLLK